MIAIIGVLVALLLPAVQRARNVRRIQCEQPQANWPEVQGHHDALPRSSRGSRRHRADRRPHAVQHPCQHRARLPSFCSLTWSNSRCSTSTSSRRTDPRITRSSARPALHPELPSDAEPDAAGQNGDPRRTIFAAISDYARYLHQHQPELAGSRRFARTSPRWE